MDNILLSGAVNDYPFAGADLNGCLNDQAGLIDMIKKNGIQIEALPYKGEEVTHDKQLQEIKHFAELMKEGSFTYHYSGHGTYDEDPLKQEPDGLREGLFPYDGKIIWDYEFKEAFRLFRPKVKVLIILDSCFSGGMSRFLAGDPLIRSRFYQVSSRLRGQRNRSVTEEINGVLFSGSAEDQTSADAYINGKYWGAWSYHLIKTFQLGYSQRQWQEAALASLIKAKKFEQRPKLLGAGNANVGCFEQEVRQVTNKGCLLKFLPK